MSIRNEIEALLEQGYSGKEIAERLEVSPSTVSRVRKSLEEAPVDALKSEESTGDKGRDEYRQMVRSQLPVKERARILVKLAKDKNPAIALRALEMADEISGWAASQPVQPALVPLFALPEGTKSPFKPNTDED